MQSSAHYDTNTRYFCILFIHVNTLNGYPRLYVVKSLCKISLYDKFFKF